MENAGPGAPEPITVEAVIDDSGLSGRGRRTVLQVSWQAADPLGVQLLLTAQPDHPALPRGQWVVLRDFLAYGLERAAGDGEVKIRPDEIRDRVWFELARPGRSACVSMARPLLREFLARTERVVPLGAERSAEALEAVLPELLQP